MAQKHCSNDYQSMSNYVSLYDLNLQPFSTYLIYLLYYIYSKFILNILSNIYYIIYIYLVNQFTLCKTKKKTTITDLLHLDSAANHECQHDEKSMIRCLYLLDAIIQDFSCKLGFRQRWSQKWWLDLNRMRLS